MVPLAEGLISLRVSEERCINIVVWKRLIKLEHQIVGLANSLLLQLNLLIRQSRIESQLLLDDSVR